MKKTTTNQLYAVQEYNKDTDAWDYKHEGPLSRSEALKHAKDLRRWAQEDESGKRYRRVRVYIV